VLSLSWPEFDALNRATNAEFLDLLSDQLAQAPVDQSLLIDGGFTHPSVLTQVVSAANIVCLETSDDIRFHAWETSEERAAMKGWVHDLPNGQEKWQRFLFFDKMIAETLVNESKAAGIPVLTRHEDTSTEMLTGLIKTSLGLESRD